MAYNFIEETGIIVADTSTIKDEITQEYKDNFGADLVTDNGSPASVLITKDTLQRTNLVESAALLANQINPDLAGGKFLDSIWSLTNGQRRDSTPTTVKATITGVAGTVLPIDSIAETTTNNRFKSIEQVTIPISGTIDVIFQSEQLGSIPCPIESLINIVDGGVLGWETITNYEAGVLGLETQSDIEARVDRKLTLAKGAKAIPFSITSGLYSIDDVKSLKFRENKTSTTKIIDGVTMIPHSIYICIDGGSDTDIANTLYDYKTLGCGYNNGASSTPKLVSIMAPDTGQDYEVKFDRPDEIEIKIQITVKSAPSAVSPIVNIKNAILSYANSAIRTEGFKVGISVSPFELSQIVTADTGYFVTDCKVTKLIDDNFQTATIPINIWEKAITTESLIEVILI